ncbi:uncharacterized protein LOC124817532 isoform X1 [Hydra vulgaris]|uniref:uncharacterized protein LOC124817532 isoform X1 n=1 Tax=Hydra vulgaris TaxID=6087 RepID=UPI001F5FD40A|nr:uncharacterized protein LOC124817532 [Hydra vulgaris]
MRIKYLENFYGCCQLRTAVMFIAMVDSLFGTYEVLDFSIRILLSASHSISHTNISNTTIYPESGTNNRNSTMLIKALPKFYFAGIVVGCLDVFISFFLLYVAARRKYKLHIVVFIAAVWCTAMGFLSLISFALSVTGQVYMDIAIFLITAVVEFYFAYVIFSYHKLICMVLERGLHDTNMTYFPEDHLNFTTDQTNKPVDEQPIMDDQDDLQMEDTGRAIAS